jgi:molybdate transport system substrate-binding protein
MGGERDLVAQMIGARRTAVATGVLVTAVLVTAGLATGCGDSPSTGDDSTGGTGPSGELLVFAAASLTEAFDDIADAFEREFPGVDVQLNLAGSSTLREQIVEGAPASVFASADQARMEEVVDADLVAGTPVVFATNSLTIAVPNGNPADIADIADFADTSLLVGACATGVPCGDLSTDVFALAGVAPSIDTYEPDVRSLLTKIADGELDAGLVYSTDIAARLGDVEEIALPDELTVQTEYPIATLLDAPNPIAAADFVEFVLSDDGRTILLDHGFASP